MTTAVCFKCGSMKFGAFNPCPKCQTSPETEDDYAVSLAMTEHYFPKGELEKMGTQLSKGEELYIDPEVKWRFIQMLKAEGVGRPDSSSRPSFPLDAINLVAEGSAEAQRSWWKFWRE